ncbi:PepSY domain-containing protein [Winogradskyella sp. SYSU M77433]|uniref:PepSY domain-containing protein n=1 Tax=Winogradskyella sp. SYSU M77433 TaxID=3042722 RepID=UPI002481390F|nr:PepSY domain-containing protein [Winogradskyella sp. SYSU M77433]MDH7914101.1 PepSY domain-containing protein [Winogradskyella sp. SYSU M77433]
MTISIWRFSHLMLALVSSIFIALAAITGLILAFEPISNQLKPYNIDGNTTLATTVQNLSESYDEIITIETDENDFVVASVITNEGDSETFYVNPETGENLGELIEKAPLFRFATNLHRSLFLKSTGRFIVGLVSFFLILMAITGVVLIARRQGGILKFFSKVINEDFSQYYHVELGRWFLIPIIIVAFTGVYLSLEKFSLLPETKISHTYPEAESENLEKVGFNDFKVFNDIKISEVKSFEFPFSDDVEDYFFIKLKDKELLVNQYSGEIVSEQQYPLVQLMSQWSLWLHTGRGTLVWSVVLALVCLALFFFIYSGFAMTLKRRNKIKKTKNKFNKDDAEYIILVGSETGNTNDFARLFFNALLENGKKAYITELNNYSNFSSAKEIIVFTSTYGEGEAPISANKFDKILPTIHQNKEIQYSVVGFGSLLYEAYCKYAEDVDAMLKQQENFVEKLPVFKINNQSFEAFKTWLESWSAKTDFNLIVKAPAEKLSSKYTRQFEVVKRTELNVDDTFLLQLRPKKKIKFQSGDLLAFRPNKNEAARQYSIAKVNGDILLSIKKHDKGLCSTYFSELNVSDVITATIEYNNDFHFPKENKNVVLIANGTGIAPFLGMIQENSGQQNISLFWGGRTKRSVELYADTLNEALENETLSQFYAQYSQEQEHKLYVQDIIVEHSEFMANHLRHGGKIMICGSIAMQNRVLEVINDITTKHLEAPLCTFENNGQLAMDCY